MRVIADSFSEVELVANINNRYPDLRVAFVEVVELVDRKAKFPDHQFGDLLAGLKPYKREFARAFWAFGYYSSLEEYELVEGEEE